MVYLWLVNVRVCLYVSADRIELCGSINKHITERRREWKMKEKKRMNILFRQISIWFQKYAFRFFFALFFCTLLLVYAVLFFIVHWFDEFESLHVLLLLTLNRCGPYESIFCTFLFMQLFLRGIFSLPLFSSLSWSHHLYVLCVILFCSFLILLLSSTTNVIFFLLFQKT